MKATHFDPLIKAVNKALTRRATLLSQPNTQETDAIPLLPPQPQGVPEDQNLALDKTAAPESSSGLVAGNGLVAEKAADNAAANDSVTDAVTDARIDKATNTATATATADPLSKPKPIATSSRPTKKQLPSNSRQRPQAESADRHAEEAPSSANESSASVTEPSPSAAPLEFIDVDSGVSGDAFQKLLGANNISLNPESEQTQTPEVEDRLRVKAPPISAPKPSKQSGEQNQAKPGGTSADSKEEPDDDWQSATGHSLRSWFSPRKDADPPAPPDSDPTASGDS